MSSEDAVDERVTAAQVENLADSEGFFEKGKGGSQGLFFQIFDGSLCLKSKEVVDGWEGPVTTENPRTKELVNTYVKRFDKVICRIVDLRRVKKEFEGGGRAINWNFTLLAGGKKATLQATWCDPFLRKFLKVAPNIDFNQSVLISAFRANNPKGGDKVLRISIRQGGTGPNTADWNAVPFYWNRPLDEHGKFDTSKPAVGPDGSVLPEAIQDPEDDSWDFKEQQKFLREYFVQNVLPKIEEVGKALGIEHREDVTGDAPMFTGAGPTEIAVVTERPADCEAHSLEDAMTPTQAATIRKLATTLESDPDALSEKLCGCDFDELSRAGASYMTYRLEKKIKKLGLEKAPSPLESKLKPAIEEAKKQSQQVSYNGPEDDDEIPFGNSSAFGPEVPPNMAAAKAAPAADDDEW